MTQLKGYKLLKLLDTNEDSDFYEGTSILDEKKVLIRILKKVRTQIFSEDEWLRKMETFKTADISNLLKPIFIDKSEGNYYFIYEPMSVLSLHSIIKKGQISVEHFLSISIKLTSLLLDLHQKKMMIGYLNPNHILVDFDQDQVFLTEINDPLFTNQERQRISLTNILYSSPEYTGRTGKEADFRSDLYSLGVLFYEMLTNHNPFKEKNLIEIMHAHFSQVPISPTKINPSIPNQLSLIVMKLMEKTPEKRYQTTLGLKKDLEKCDVQWKITGVISAFSCGVEDLNSTYNKEGMLVGRETELNELQSIYHFIKNGHKEFILISGNSGSGKTALVNEFRKQISEENVIFVSGKWEQFERNIPYAPIIQAFKSFFRVIVSRGDATVKKWRELFLKKLGNQSQMIASLIPEFGWIIGSQIVEEEIGVLERQNSILFTFQRFLSTITEEIPFILFIDDVQWADKPTIDLLRYLMNDDNVNHFLVILAARNEKQQSANSFRNLKAFQELNIRELKLKSLNEHQIRDWILKKYQFQQNIESLVTFINTISKGNPFFVKQLLLTLEKESSIYLNKETYQFEFYLSSRTTKSFLGNDCLMFLGNKIETLPQPLQFILKFASCLGSHFSLNELSVTTQIDKSELISSLYVLIKEGIIILIQNHDHAKNIKFEFIHDKVQQAIYANLSEVDKTQFHYKIGMRLRFHKRQGDEINHLLKIIDHLNLSIPILNKEEKIQLATLNAKGGNHAKRAAAFEAAYQYFVTGKKLLSNNCWNEQYDLSYQIYIGLGECAYLNSKFQEADQAFEILLEEIKTKEEKFFVYNLRILLYHHLNREEEAVQSGKNGLQLFGWNLDRRFTKWTILKELILIQLSKQHREPAKLLQLPIMKSKLNVEIIQSLVRMNSPAFHVDQNLATFLMLRAFRFSLENGNTDVSPLVYVSYGLILSAGFGNFEKSCEIGEVAIKQVNDSQIKKYKGQVYFVYASFINHWKYPLRQSVNYLTKSQDISLEIGDHHLAGAGGSFIVITQLLAGEPIHNVLDVANQQISLSNKLQFKISNEFLLEFKLWLEFLMNENDFVLSELKEIKIDPAGFIIHHTLRLMMYFILDDEESCRKIIEELNKVITKALVLVIAPEFYFYHTLWLSRFYAKASTQEQKKMKKLINRNLKIMEKWSKQSPLNYSHKYFLMEAEALRTFKKGVMEENLYEKAAQYALQNGFIQDAAIACECAGKYYLDKGLSRLGGQYIKEAYDLFENWGAQKKLELLAEQYPNFFEISRKKSVHNDGQDLIDLESLLRASRTISSEIVLEKVIETLIEIVIENAGATTGALFLQEENQIFLPNNSEKENMEVINANNAEDLLSVNIIRYVQKTQEPIVLDHACEEGLFKFDSYIQKHKIRSVVCFPIRNHAELIGAIYLENNLLTHAFTEKEILLLSMLGSQAAISIQNAQLYFKLEEKVKTRTLELQEANESLEKANLELENAEKSRMELLSNISHDLRNPITSIQGYIEAMLDGIVIAPEKQIMYLRRSKEKIYALNRLIQDLFDLSRLQYGNMSFSKEIVRVDKLFTYLCDGHEWEIENAGLAFRREIDSGITLYPMVEVDVGRLQQVVSNIISNALKYTEFGEIIMKLHIGSEYATFEVSDTGQGVHEDEVQKMFERSFKGRDTSNVSGNGLGLSICKEIVTYHHGEIWAESVYGKGTTIYFTIPVISIDQKDVTEIDEQHV